MMTAAMTVGAKCNSIADAVRAVLSKMLYMMDFEKRSAIFFKRGL